MICRVGEVIHNLLKKNDTVECWRPLFYKLSQVEVVYLDPREESHDLLSEKKPTSH